MPVKRKKRVPAATFIAPEQVGKMEASDEYLLFLHCQELEVALKWLIRRFSESYDPDELAWIGRETEIIEQQLEQLCQN